MDNDAEECATVTEINADAEELSASASQESTPSGRRRRQPAQTQEPKEQSYEQRRGEQPAEAVDQPAQRSSSSTAVGPSSPESKAEGSREPAAELSPRKNVKKKAMGPSKPPVQLSGQYPEDDPDYCVWMPPAGQTGDGRTSLNDKYGY